MLAALARKTEAYFVAIDGDVPVLQSGQPIAIVLLRVVLVADADQRRLKKMNDGCQYFFARQSAPSHVLVHFFANRGQFVREGDDMLIFGAFSHFAKKRVIAILFASLRVASRRLKMTVGEGTYPNVPPCRGNDQGLDALEHICVREFRAVRAGIAESRASLPAAYARPCVRNVSEAYGLRGILRIDDALNVFG